MGCTLLPSMKSVGEITTQIWPGMVSCLVFYPFLGKFDLDDGLDRKLDLRSRSSKLWSLNVP